MAEAVVLRHALADFLGAERFRKFVQQLRRAGRLRYWQEQEWGRFVAHRPEFAVSADELAVALRVCWLHGAELQPDTVEVIDGQVDYTDRYIRAKAAEFPDAASSPVWSQGHPFPTRTVGAWFCPMCRSAEAAWQQRHAAPDAATKATEKSARWEQMLAEIRAQRCPSCGSSTVSRFCYGLPELTDAMNAALDAKLIFLAGCTFFEDDPEWVCRNCAHTWGRVFPVVTQEAEPAVAPDPAV